MRRITILAFAVLATSFACRAESYVTWTWNGSAAIPDGPDGNWVRARCPEKSGIPSGSKVTKVKIEHTITHTYVGDLEVEVYNGNHTWRVRDNEGGSADDINETRTEYSLFDGDNPSQDWYYRVRDTAEVDTGTLTRIKLYVYYDPPAPLPDPDLEEVRVSHTSVNLGQPITVTIRAENDANVGLDGSSITASIDHSSGASRVDVAASRPSWATGWALARPGDTIYHRHNGAMAAQDWLVEPTEGNWTANESHELTITITPRSTGTVYIRVRTTMTNGSNWVNDRSVSNGHNATDQQGWEVREFAVTVVNTGTVEARLKNVPESSYTPNSPRIVLQTNPSRQIRANPATFTGVTAGTYGIEGYQTGNAAWGEELWYRGNVAAEAGRTKTYDLVRHYPFCELKMYRNGVEVGPGTTIVIGDRIRARLRITNRRNQSLSVKAALRVDRSRTAPYDHSLEFAQRTVSANGSTDYISDFTVTETGAWHHSYGIYAYVNGSWQLTDCGDWYRHLNVVAGVIETTLKNIAGATHTPQNPRMVLQASPQREVRANPARFTGLASGSYGIYAYQTGAQQWGEELWYVGSVTAVAGETRTYDLVRHYPYGELKMYRGGSEVGPGSTIGIGDSITAKLRVTNPRGTPLDVKATLHIDRNQSAPYDRSQAFPSRSVSADGATEYSFTFTVNQVGAWHQSYGVYAGVNGSWQLVDCGDWYRHLNVVTGTIQATLKNVPASTYTPQNPRIVLKTDPEREVRANPATFTGLPSGSFGIEACQTGAAQWGEELWYQGHVTAEAGATRSYDLVRHFPYGEMKMYKGGVEVGPGSRVSIGDLITAKLTVANPNGAGLPVKATLYVDRGQSAPYDASQVFPSRTVSSGGHTEYTLQFTVDETGYWHHSYGVFAQVDGEWRLTDCGDWYRHLEVVAGTIQTTLKNIPASTYTPRDPRILLHADPQREIRANPASFTGLASGTYDVEAYQTGCAAWGEELWFAGEVTAVAGEVRSYDLVRHLPYGEMKMYKGGVEVGPGSDVGIGDTITAKLTLTNPYGQTLNVKANLRVDRDKAAPYDHAPAFPSRSLAPGATTTYTYDFTVDAVGDWHHAYGIYAGINGGWQLTDCGDWYRHLHVVAGTITATLKNIASSSYTPRDPRIVLRTNPTRERRANPATFDALAPGSYGIEGYQTGAAQWGEELWYEGTATAVGEETRSYDLVRHFPTGEMRMFRDGTEVGPGSTVAVGDRITARLLVTNRRAVPVRVMAKLRVDRDRAEPYDVSTELQARDIGAQASAEFTFDFVLSDVGDWHHAYGVFTEVGNVWQLTDCGDWYHHLTASREGLNWLRLRSGGGDLQIHCVTRDGSTIPTDRPLVESLDTQTLTDIYVVDSEGRVLSWEEAFHVLVCAQSAAKYRELTPNVPRAVDHADFPEDPRDGYTAHPPHATREWWRWMFIYNEAGLDDPNSRAKRYAEVLLDAVLQPDIAGSHEAHPQLRERLSRICTLASSEAFSKLFKKSKLTQAGLSLLTDVLCNPEATHGELSLTVVEKLSQAFTDKKVRRFFRLPELSGKYFNYLFNGLGAVKGLLESGKRIEAGLIRQQFLLCLANAEAEGRLRALRGFANRAHVADPAFYDGLSRAEERFAEIQASYESELPGILRAAWESEAVVTYAQFAAGVARTFGHKAIGKVLLPYVLSWETYKLIREQVNNAAWATVAAMLVHELDDAGGVRSVPSDMIVGDTVNETPTMDAIALLDVYYYLGHYAYARTEDTAHNDINAGIFGLFFGDSYAEYIAYLKQSDAEALARGDLLAPSPYLTRHRRPLDPGQTDDEVGWLAGLVRDYIPIQGEPELEAGFDIIGSAEGRAPFVADFRDRSSGGTILEWQFGDGARMHRDALGGSASHVYTKPGVYVVTVVVRNGEQEAVSGAKTITVTLDRPLADFRATNTEGPAPLSVAFEDRSQGFVEHWAWSFGDGEVSSERHPTHVYAQPGTYSVELRVTNCGGSTFTRREDLVVAHGPRGIITVNCNLDPAGYELDGPVHTYGGGRETAFSDLPSGDYTLRFKDLPGYNSPDDRQIALEPDDNIVVEAQYSAIETPVLAVSPMRLDAQWDAGSRVFRVSNNGAGTLNWSAEVVSGIDWLSITSGAGGTGDGEINCAWTANHEGAERTGTIRVTAAGADGSPVEINLYQEGAPEISCSTDTLTATCLVGTSPSPQGFEVWNAGCGSLDYSIAVDRIWLRCSPESGFSSGARNEVAVEYAAEGLAAGTHHATITVSDTHGRLTEKRIAVTLTVNNEEGVVWSLAPSGTYISGERVELEWTTAGGSTSRTLVRHSTSNPPTGAATAPQQGPEGVYTDGIDAPVVTERTTHHFQAHAHINGKDVSSAVASIAVLPAQAASLQWTEEPSGTFMSGERIPFAWTSNGMAVNETNVRWGLSNPPSPENGTTTYSGGDYFTDFVDAPVVTEDVTYFFRARALIQGQEVHSTVASVIVTPRRYTLRVTADPSDGGSIEISPEPGQDGRYIAGTVVTLTATPNAEYLFDSWDGDTASVSNPHNVVIGADRSIKARFTRMAPPVATIEVDVATAAEPSTNGSFVVGIDRPTASDLEVSYTVDGSATGGEDFLALPGTVTIPAGQTSATIAVTTVDDDAVEGEEAVSVALAEGAGYTVGAPDSASVTIGDDDVPTVHISASVPAATEAADNAEFKLELSQACRENVAINYMVGGTATPGTDYGALSGSVEVPAGETTAAIQVVPTEDYEREGTESVVVTLAPDTVYVVGTPDSATVTIRDGNHNPSIESLAASPQQGYAPLAVQFTCSASDPNGDELHYAWDFADGDRVPDGKDTEEHTFAASGQYAIVLTVSDGRGGKASESILIDVLPSERLTLNRTVLRLNFRKSGRDRLQLAGTIVLKQGTKLAGLPVELDFGGVVAKGTMDKRGRVRAGNFKFKLKGGPKRTSRNRAFTARLTRGSWATTLADDGCTPGASGIQVEIKAVLRIGDTPYKGTALGTWNSNGKAGVIR